MSRVQDKATTERNTRTLRELVKRPENKSCADCKRNDPRWASWNLGVFVCIRCSGVHRGMGTHISKVKSVDLDTWTPEQMASITRWGNARANAYWEAHLKAGHAPPDHKIESFIRSKYESRRWAREGPPPEDPSVLDAAGGATASAEQALPDPPPASPARQQAPAAVAPVSARGVVSSQPVPQRGLLSAQQLRERPPGAASPHPPTGGSGAPKAAAPAPPAPKPVDDIFSLDFNAPASTSAPSASHAPSASKDVKTDIMSLFSKGPAPGAGVLGGGGGAFGQPQGAGVWGATPQQAPVQQQQQAGMWGATPQAAGGDFGTWGGAAPAAAAPPAQQAFGTWGGAPAQHVPPPATNVWGAPAQSQAPAGAGAGGAFGADIWGGSGGFGGAPAQPKKDDAFGDLWSSFK